MTSVHMGAARRRIVLGAVALGLAACGDGESAAKDTDGNGQAPLYAVESLIFGDEGSTSFVGFLPSLDKQPKVLLQDAREFAGYAPADAHGGKVIVGSGEQASLTRYAISDDLVWTEENTVSFANYTTQPLDASLYLSADKALIPFEKTAHIVWNPATFEIVAEIEGAAEIPISRGELIAFRGYGHALREGTLFQPYYWADESYHKYSEISQISVLDTASEEIKAVLNAPCPHLHIVSQDDQGNVYFSNGQGSIAAAVLNDEHPRNCFVRIKAGEEVIDETFTMDFRELTDGREGSNLFYLGEGKALFNVYHAERDNLRPDSEFEEVDYSANYHLWVLDLESMEATMMEGIDFSGGQFVAFRIDDRVFVTIPAPDYSETAVYEALPAGRLEKLFDVQGWAFKMFRVR